MMLYLIFIMLVLMLLRRHRRMGRVLEFSREIRNHYVALPFIGHGYMFLGSHEDRMIAFQKFAVEAIKNKHGVTSMWLTCDYYAVISDPIVAETVSKICLDKPESVQHVAKPLMGNGLAFAPVDIWRPRRIFLAPTFTPKYMNCFVPEFARQGLILGECLKPMVGVGTFSVWNHMTSYTMDAVCQMVLGVNVNAQGHSDHPFLKAFDEYSKALAERICQNWLQWDPLYKCLPVYARAERNRKIIHDFVDKVVREKLESLEQMDSNLDMSSPQKVKDPSYLEFLISASSGTNRYTNADLRDEAIILILAGTDTTAVGAAYTVLMLSRHLDVQKKAYEEVHEIFGDSKRAVTQEDLSRMIYIEAVIKESLRLYPPAPVVARNVHKDVKIPSGLTLPAGIYTIFNIWGINRNPRYWGEDADQFDPDRFLKGPLKHQAAFMTFSYGPRNCLGQKYAIMAIKIVVATVLRDYIVLPPSEVTPEDLKKPLRLAFEIMMKDVDDFKIRLEHRNK